jgi:hypothetical protein
VILDAVKRADTDEGDEKAEKERGLLIKFMNEQLEAAGARVFFGHRLTGVYATGAAPTTRGGGSSGALTSAVSGSSSSLHFAGGQVVTASAVLLNLPRLVLQRLDPASIVFPTDTTQLSWQLLKNCTPCFDPSAGSAVPNWLAVKVYTQYDDPWWITKLGLEQGSFVDTEHSPPLVGRYHDGPVSRADDGSVDGPGLLEAVYAYTTSQPSIRFYEPFADDPAEDPLTITTDPALLLPLHRRLMEFHAAAFAKIGLNATRDVPPPTKVVLGIWTSDELAALPQPMSSNFRAQVPSCPAESCLDGVSAPQYNAATASPNPAANIHIANNDFAITLEQGVPCCWAEQSLKSVERTLHTAWGLGRPTWLDPEYYAQLLVAEETSDAPDAPEAIGVYSFFGIGLLFIPLAAAGMAMRRKIDGNVAFAVFITVTAWFTASMMRGHHGGFVNVFIVLHWTTAALAGIALYDMSERLPRVPGAVRAGGAARRRRRHLQSAPPGRRRER